MSVHLTKMADCLGSMVTNEDVANMVDTLMLDPDTRVIVMNAALCDFDDEIGDVLSGAHAPLRPDAPDMVPVRSQRDVECGSHACGLKGLVAFDGIKAVMLDNHGPNIVFHRDTDPTKVIAFLERNFDLTAKTGGPVEVQSGEAGA